MVRALVSNDWENPFPFLAALGSCDGGSGSLAGLMLSVGGFSLKGGMSHRVSDYFFLPSCPQRTSQHKLLVFHSRGRLPIIPISSPPRMHPFSLGSVVLGLLSQAGPLCLGNAVDSRCFSRERILELWDRWKEHLKQNHNVYPRLVNIFHFKISCPCNLFRWTRTPFVWGGTGGAS